MNTVYLNKLFILFSDTFKINMIKMQNFNLKLKLNINDKNNSDKFIYKANK